MMESPTAASNAPQTIVEAFGASVRRNTQKIALKYKDREGKYTGITYSELDRLSSRLAGALSDLGIGHGDRVAIISYHGPEWVIADLAVLKLGAIVVPVYHTLSPSAIRYILHDSGCRLVFIENADTFAPVEAVCEELPDLEHAVIFDDNGDRSRETCLYFSDLVAGDRGADDSDITYAEVSPEDTATIVYTSGTTGDPKGVVLSHHNITSNALAVSRRFGVSSDDSFLSFLPLCHMLEKTCGYYTMLFSGVAIAYAGNLETIVDDVRTIRPTPADHGPAHRGKDLRGC